MNMRCPRWMLALGLWTAASAWADLPFRPETDPGETSASWGAAVVIALLLCAAAVAIVRKKGWRPSGWSTGERARPARVRTVVPLGAGARLIEVEHRGRTLLLGVTATQVTLLETTPGTAQEDA